MKFIIIIIMLLLFIQTVPAQWEIGLIGGLNRSSLSGDKPNNASYKTLIGPAFGLLIETRLTSDVRIGIQPQYLQRGSKIVYNIRGEYVPVDSLNFKIDYFILPLIFKVYASNQKTYLISGLDVGFPVSATIENLDSSEGEDVLERLNSVDIAVNFGFGVRFPVMQYFMAVELKYIQGIANLNDPLPGEGSPLNFSIRSTGFQLFTSISLPLGKEE